MQVFITCSETVLKWIDGVSVEILKIKTNFVDIIYRKKRAMQSDKQVKLHNKSKKCIERPSHLLNMREGDYLCFDIRL